MMKFKTFEDASGSANEAAYNDLHERIMSLKGLPSVDGLTTDWARPLPHPTEDFCAMPIDATCYPAMTDVEIASLKTREELAAAGWFPNPLNIIPTKPWWGFLIWWR